MKVACATAHMAGYYKTWFKDVSVIGDVGKVPKKLDLLILTGGSDVNPERYHEAPDGAMGWNNERDTIEFGILDRVLQSIPSIKILGVCRGMQLLNVFYSGNLFQDLGSENLGHQGVHQLEHSVPNAFSWLKVVNSLHHQAVKNFGVLGGNPRSLATEPKTGICEIATFGRRSLGVQFHPEMFSKDIGDKFFSQIKDWVSGEIKIVEEPEPSFKFASSPVSALGIPSIFTTVSSTISADFVQQEQNINNLFDSDEEEEDSE